MRTPVRCSLPCRGLMFWVVIGALFSSNAPLGAATRFPLDFMLPDDVVIEPSPARFRFQGRISQAGIPLEDGALESVDVELMNDLVRVCWQRFTAAGSADAGAFSLHDSVLTLDINNLECTGGKAADRVIAEFPRLTFRVCIQGNCLAQVPLASVPYVTKATRAYEAHQVREAEVAAQAEYAYYGSADLETLATGGLPTTGHFDFASPTTLAEAAELTTDYAPYSDQGLIAWVPFSVAPGARTINICAKNAAGHLVNLRGFVVHAAATALTGNLDVGGTSTFEGPVQARQGLVVSGGNVEVTSGDVRIAGNLGVGPVRALPDVVLGDFDGADGSATGVLVPEGTVSANTIQITNKCEAPQYLIVGDLPDPLPVMPGMYASKPATFTGNLTVGDGVKPAKLVLEGDVVVGAGAAPDEPDVEELVVNSDATFHATTRFSGDVLVGADAVAHTAGSAELAVDSPACFEGGVTFSDDTSTTQVLGDVVFNAPITLSGEVEVEPGSVGSSALREGAVDSRTILDGSLGGEHFADGAVGGEHLEQDVAIFFRGLSWETWDTVLTTSGGADIAYGAGVWVAVDDEGGVYTSWDSGDTWSSQTFADSALRGVAYAGPSAGWMIVGDDTAGSSCVVLSSTDGENWTPFAPAPAAGCTSVAGADSGTWVVLNQAVSELQTWDGAAWQSYGLGIVVDGGELAYDSGVWMVAASEGWRDEGVVLRSTDGVAWVVHEFPDTNPQSVATDGNGRWLVAGDQGVWELLDDGQSWSRFLAGKEIRGVGHAADTWFFHRSYRHSIVVDTDPASSSVTTFAVTGLPMKIREGGEVLMSTDTHGGDGIKRQTIERPAL